MSSADEQVLRVRIAVPPANGASFHLDVAFEAPPGITILFGPSGAGKSTSLGVIAGLVRPPSGRVTVGDEVWFDSAAGVDRPVHLRGVSYVFQSLALFPHLTAARNVEYGIARDVPVPERRRRALAMLERMHVGHLAQRRPGTFSGGEAQRVALARAFAREPRVVLLDEAFSALDRDLRRDLCAEVRAMVEERRIPAIMVTHHRMEARAMGDRIVVLAAGRVAGSGRVDDLLPAQHSGEPHGADLDALDSTPMPLMVPPRGSR